MITTGKQAFFFAVQDLSRAMKRRFEQAAAEYGLTLPQWRVLGQLTLQDGITQRVLADHSDTDQMTLGKILERLEAKGFVSREPDPHDSRAKIVRLTAAARDVAAASDTVSDAMYAQAMAGVDPADSEALVATLRQISANLSKSHATE